MTLKDYEIRQAEDDERPVVLSFLMQHFFPDEYLLRTYLAKNKDRINEKEEQIIKEDFRRKYEILLKSHPCLVAIHRETRKIAGINMMFLEVNPNMSNNNLNSSTDGFSFNSKILSEWYTSVIDAAIDSVNYFQELPTINATLDIVNLSVDSAHAGKGLATALIRGAIDLARNRKIDVVCGLFTSPFSQRAAEKIGFKIYKDIHIISFRDSQGNVVYDGMEPYEISMMALML